MYNLLPIRHQIDNFGNKKVLDSKVKIICSKFENIKKNFFKTISEDLRDTHAANQF